MRRSTMRFIPLACLVAAGVLVTRAEADRDRHGHGERHRGHDDDDDDAGVREDLDDHRGRGRGRGVGGRAADAAARATPGWVTYEKECGACHLAYPPRFLPPGSWSALLAGLDDHFGENAELDAAAREELERWLARFAGPAVTGAPPLRITTLPWWQREHDEVPAAVWKRSAVGSASNCAACHRGAPQGRFSEHDVRIPRDARPPR